MGARGGIRTPVSASWSVTSTHILNGLPVCSWNSWCPWVEVLRAWLLDSSSGHTRAPCTNPWLAGPGCARAHGVLGAACASRRALSSSSAEREPQSRESSGSVAASHGWGSSPVTHSRFGGPLGSLPSPQTPGWRQAGLDLRGSRARRLSLWAQGHLLSSRGATQLSVTEGPGWGVGHTRTDTNASLPLGSHWPEQVTQLPGTRWPSL